MYRPNYADEISGFGFEGLGIDNPVTRTRDLHRSRAPFNGDIQGDVTSRYYRCHVQNLGPNDCMFVGMQVPGPMRRMVYHAQVVAITQISNLLVEPCVGYFSAADGGDARGLYRPDYTPHLQSVGRMAQFKGTLRPVEKFDGNLVVGAYFEATGNVVDDHVRVYVSVNRYSQPDLLEMAQ